jgi:hypothetical protein
MLHITHRVCGHALSAALLLIGIGAIGMTGAAAQGYTRGPSGLHARCDAALFRFPFGRLANDEVHDGQAGTVESGMPGRDGA